MKQKLLNKLWLRVGMIVAVMTTALAGTVWAADVTTTYTFTSKSWAATSGGSSADWTSGQDGAGFSNNGIQVTKNASGANGTSPVSFTNVKKIVVTYNTNKNQGEGSIEAKVGNNAATSNSVGYSGSANGTSANFTTEFNYSTLQSGDVKLTVNCTKNSIYLVSVAITTESSLTASDLAITGAPVALSFDLYNNASAQTVNFTTSSTGTVTVSGGGSYVTTSVSGNTITVTPVRVTPSAQTITVSQAADATYDSGSATFTVNVSDSTPFEGGDVTFVAGTDVGTTTSNNSPDEVTKSVVTMSSTDAAFATTEYRFYANSTTTFSTSQGTITRIVFTDADTKNPCSNLSTTTGTYSGNTWTGNATSVDFTASAQARSSQVAVTISMSSDPIINADDVNIAYDVTSGSIGYTITNPVTGTSLTASTDASWLTIGTVTSSAVPFTCSANDGSEDRTATVTLTYGEVTKTVTVTQAHLIVDYATLPFVYDGNGTMLGDATGVTVSGLGAYTSSPAIKFDSDGDYFFIKINERPGKLTFDIKCNQSNGEWEGTFKVQTSTDGETYTDAASYTDLTPDVESKTIRNLPADARYIKFIYAKTTGNVALGKINLAVYSTDPEIDAEDVEIAYDATSGSIAYEIFNSVTGGTLTASTEADWLTLGTVGATVPFTCTANTAASARTATVTLSYTYGNSQTITQTMTVTQAGDPDALMTIAEVRAQDTGSVVHTKGVVTSVNGRTGYIQDAEAAIVVYGSSDLTCSVGDEIEVSGTLSTFNGLLEITNPTTVTVLSSGNSVEPEVMTVAQVNSSTKQGWLVKIIAATVTAIDNIDNQNVTLTQGENSITVRFNNAEDIKFEVNDIITLTGNIGCYNTTQIANPTDVNIVGGPVNVTISTVGYSTLYYSDRNLIVPAGVTAYTYRVGTKLEVSHTYGEGEVIPAGTAVVLKKTTSDTSFSFVSTTDTGTADANNLLKGSDEAATTTGGNYYYALTLDKEGHANSVGFYWMNETGAAFTNGAHKAYLALDKTFADYASSTVKGYIALPDEDDPTAIENVNVNVDLNEGIYNLAGQRLQKMQKGINIVNGKKILK